FGEVQNGSQDTVPGLFAIGECAAARFHGFNRLAANSILELITMGKFAGERVLEYLKEAPAETSKAEGEHTLSLFSGYLEAQGRDSLGRIREAMQTMMTGKAGVFRTEAGLLEAVEGLKELKDRAAKTALSTRGLIMNQELVRRWELDNLLTVSMVIACAALNRRESRGAHYREDFPERKNEYNYHTLTTMEESGRIEFGKRPVDMSILEAGGEHAQKFGMIKREY
ncbi:MAG: FAD-binding protein, partial [Deltaproteobacteria bacterium]|nr:FAD-binding protein [Deltaproteobacteria bacterium]